ncbi:MAG: phosphoglycerate mutase, partial [Clostridia bacterium]|nr:phosphoglycerate mutase [Clostridia bacterium]
YIHVEAPDECGHQGNLESKIKAIELFDEKVVGPVMNYLENCGEEYAVLVMPDHPTPVKLKTHVRDSVPFAMFKSNVNEKSGLLYNEKNGKNSGVFIEKGSDLMVNFTGIDK